MSQVAIHNRSRALAALFHPAALFVLLMLLAVRAFAGGATLAWDPVSSSSLAGYMLYYGPTAGNYTTKIDVGNTTTRAVSSLTDGATYHFAVTAYDSSRTESGFSNDVTATVPAAATAPVANFSASATSGVAPLALNFTNSSTGTITSYAWTFGDGTSSIAQSPSHVYAAAGVYTVGLTVTGSGGSNTKTMPNYINVASSTSSDTSAPTVPSTLAASGGGSTSVNLSWNASTDNVGVTGYRIERCQGVGCTSFAQIGTATGTTFSNTGLAAATSYTYRVRATDAAGNVSGYSNTATASTTSSATAPVAAFSGSPTTGTAPLTVQFANASTGTVSSYAWNFGDGTTSTTQSPSHVYSVAGIYTVSLTVTGSAGSNTKTYTNYVTVSAAATAGALAGNMVASTASVDLSSTGSSDWARWPSYIHSATGNSQIRDIAMIGGGSPKTYYGDARTLKWTNGMPTTTGSSTTGVSASGSGKGYQLTAPADTTTRTLTLYLGVQNATATFTAHLSDGSAADYVGTTSGGKSRQDGVLTLQYRAASAGQTITVKWTQTAGGGSGNVSIQGAALAAVGGSTSTPPATTQSSCPCSVWSTSTVPSVVADSDTSAVELGVKFKSDVAGSIKGIRFYKGSTNTGTHTGSLWTATGTLLAQATFTNETASGWQTVTFSAPVAIAANTLYVASYHTNVGHYAGDNGYFSATGVDNGPLHVPQDGVSGGNGVYAYGSTPVFPTSTWSASNYWVDVVFTN